MRDYYLRTTYDHEHRWMSFYYLINETRKLEPGSILEVGIGNSFVSNYLKDRGLKVTTLDIEPELKPDIVGDVTALPCQDNEYDLVICSEVLEHIPFEKFPIALKEINRTTKKYVIISLPHWGWTFYSILKVPLLRKVSWMIKISGLKKHIFDGDHYWEIGKRGFKLSKVRNLMEKSGFRIIRDYIRPESPFHHFFILEKV